MRLDSESRSDWREIDDAILQAINKIEAQDPTSFFLGVTIPQIVEELKRNKNLKETPVRRTIYYHLCGNPKTSKPGLLDKKQVVKSQRGRYSTKRAMIGKKLAREFVIRSVYETVPRLQNQSFNEILSRSLSISTKEERQLRKKANIPLFGRLFRSKWRAIRDMKDGAERKISKEMQEDLALIEQVTEITILSSKKLAALNTENIRQVIAENLYEMLSLERSKKITLEDVDGVSQSWEKKRELLEKWERIRADKRILEDCTLNIIVTFNPVAQPLS